MVSSFSRKTGDTAEDANPLFLNSHPEVVYQVIQSVFFGALALTALRFKFLWTPHMCLFAAGIFCNQHFWKTMLMKIGLKEICVSHLLHVCMHMTDLSRDKKEYSDWFPDRSEYCYTANLTNFFKLQFISSMWQPKTLTYSFSALVVYF